MNSQSDLERTLPQKQIRSCRDETRQGVHTHPRGYTNISCGSRLGGQLNAASKLGDRILPFHGDPKHIPCVQCMTKRPVHTRMAGNGP